MYRFIEILLLPTQFVFLTGTLPSTFEKELKETLKLESSLSVIRAPTMYYVAFFAWHQLDAIFAHRPLLRKKVLQMAPTLNFRTRSVAN